MQANLSAPENFINRELSWLEFNRRVLEEAQDVTQPLMERVKFLNIFSTNLDEFFEIRIAGIKQQIDSGSTDVGPDDLSPAEVFQAITKTVHELVATQYDLWNHQILPLLAQNGVRFHKVTELSGERAAWAHHYFRNEVFPVLTPLAVDASHPFPQVLNKSHNLMVRARRPGEAEPLYAIVQVPRVAPRLIALPREADTDPWDYIFLGDLVKEHLGELFPGLELEGVHGFRLTRNGDLYIDDEEADNLLRTIEQELRRRNKGNAVRLEVKADCPRDFQLLLLERFNLTDADLYVLDGPISMTNLSRLLSNEAFARLKDRPFFPAHAPALPSDGDIWERLRHTDILLHHPYEPFEDLVSLIERAAADPQVLAIKMTLYRTSGDSPIVAALGEAAANGKQVTAIVELKARFDEANNIQWARKLEDSGVHVVYGVVGLKTHCKMFLIVRRDEDRIRQYVHLSTGNYHPSTARIYTDLGLLTSDPKLTEEVATLFNTLTGLAEYPGFKKLLVSPFDLAARFKALIERERDHALNGKPARIVAKLNSLVDETLILALYEASCAGVKIDLIIRGICCLRPGIPGVSENIRVVSIVGRFLEHSRIFYFANNGHPAVYLGSADWMPRNLYRRVEIAFPIENPALRKVIFQEILPAYLNDRAKARDLQPDGSYLRLKPSPGEEHSQAQLFFREQARKRNAAAPSAAVSDHEHPVKLTPMAKP
ncbi:MAG: polyphosphate kinase 1 [Verrucomicrobiota bacterium]